jgi:MotA/TolQ/ExbB proton channel family
VIKTGAEQPAMITSNASSVVEAFREYEISEPDAALGSLDVANEAMLKLAFVGTIWGIGSALFLVRDLDSLDPVARIITKSGMFAGIGTGFGTTMVGVLLSILASLRIQSISSRWEELVNDIIA